MKNKVAFFTIASLLLVSAALNVIIFMIVPKEITSLLSFKIVWVFTFPVNLLLTIVSTLYITSKSGDSITRFPPVMYITCVFSAIYFSVGFKLMTIPFVSPKLPLIIEMIITVCYIVVLAFVYLSVGYIEANQKYTKTKLMYIGLLEADIKSAISFTENEDLKRKLSYLAEKIRFSDPMSHESLRPCEEDIARCVGTIINTLRNVAGADVSAELTKLEGLIDYRNDRCMLLK